MVIIISDECYKKHAPEYKRYLKPSREQAKKHPRLLYLVQYGDNEPTMVFGPCETKEEKTKRYAQRKTKKEHGKLFKKTKADIREGKQNKVSSYFKTFYEYTPAGASSLKEK